MSRLMRKHRWTPAIVLAVASLLPAEAEACGGFFCSTANPVNQAAERIVFSQNADSTVTAVIEIQYQGPSESFSWLLPISSVPTGDQIAVASNVAFQRLQQATNPRYNLTTRIEGTCRQRDSRATADSGPVPSLGGPSLSNGTGSVTVEAQGVVGSFEWTVISLDETLDDPAGAAVEWLDANGYDVPQGAPGLLGPYLEDGSYLLALKLKKGADAGSIRPIVLTYEAEKPMIPIKLTAVAANDDMGVLAWVLGAAQAVPQNYYQLELNEARINWFNAASTYNAVVTAAADDAGGQGFVTEMAGPTSTLGQVIWSASDEATWANIVRISEADGNDLFFTATNAYSAYDGFWDVVKAHVPYPPGTTLAQIRECPGCNTGVPDAGFLTALEADVIEPVRLVQRLIDDQPQITRLYSTLSAPEMTVDPVFSFNPDLAPVSNVHTAERVIECDPGYYQEDAPWRIELPSGGVVRGAGQPSNTWPTALDAQPANGRIVRAGEQGAGQVVEDNTAKIQSALETYNDSVPTPPKHDSGCATAPRPADGGLGLTMLGLLAFLLRSTLRRENQGFSS